MSFTPIRHSSILKRENTALLIIDIQEKILRVMQQPEIVVDNTLKLIKGFYVLGSPIFYTEQYPKGLGETERRIKDELKEIIPIQKMSFSCSGAGNLFSELLNKNLKQIVIAGIETHVCVQQTALDLKANRFSVTLAADATSSRKQTDYNFAIERMRNAGIIISTTESILFEMLNVCGTEEFKKIAKIIK